MENREIRQLLYVNFYGK